MTDFEFEHQFEVGVLPIELFTHEAHIRLAWIHITQYGIERAITNIVHQIKTYIIKHGAKDKFNKTLTVAAVRVVYHFILKTKTKDFETFIRENSRLVTHFKELLASHYGFDIYNSEQAKKYYVEPDLLPFDSVIPNF